MSLDYLQLRKQVKKLGEQAPEREKTLHELRVEAFRIFENQSERQETLRKKVFRAASQVKNLRCALPMDEPLMGRFKPPELPLDLGIIAADGSQITPDPRGQVLYYLINVGAIRLWHGKKDAPGTFVESRLFYGDDLYTRYGTVSESMVYLKRDLRERQYLAELAKAWRQENSCPKHVFALTDGPLELWAPRETGGEIDTEYQRGLVEYRSALDTLRVNQVIVAGYVDRPRADLVVRLLEIAILPEDELGKAGTARRYRGVTDSALFYNLLEPGERSAVFGLQAQTVDDYPGDLALYFFYVNVGRDGKPAFARVEIPAWVAKDEQRLNVLHAVLIDQCSVLGTRTYPYLLHRAHEAAVVTYEERDQLTQMIALELRRRGVQLREESIKQAVKDQAKK